MMWMKEMVMKRVVLKVLVLFAMGLLGSLSFCLAANAQSCCDGGDKWEFQISPYAWLAGQKGRTATLPGLPAADIEVDFFDDILGNINGSLMLLGEARKGRWGLVADLIYTDIEAEDKTPGTLFSSIKSRTKSWIVTGIVTFWDSR